MEDISNKINELFLELFKTKKEGKYVHPFFLDLEKVIKHKKFFRKSFTTKKYNYESIKNKEMKKLTINRLKENNKNFSKKIEEEFYKYKSFDILKFEDILNAVENGESLSKIRDHVHKASKMRIPSNVKNNDEKYFSNYFPGSDKYTFHENKSQLNDYFLDKKLLNIAIIGAGPVGLFVALYLNFFFNNYSLNNQPNVRVIIFENRIDKVNGTNYRKPYTRDRTFVTNSGFLSSIFNKIYCLDNQNKNIDTNSLFININVLEYILLSKVYLNNIPIIFKNYDYTQLYDIMENLDIDVIFDGSGGRLESDYCINNICLPNIPKWLLNETYEKIPKNLVNLLKKEYTLKEKEIFDMVQTIPSENKVVFNKSEKFIKNYYYASITCYELKTLKWIEKIDIIIENESDLKLLSQLKKQYYKLDDILLIGKLVKDKNERNKILKMYKNKINNLEFVFYLDVWHTYMRHSLEASKIIGKNKKILKINIGDTLFHSHFMIGAGLNRSLNFGVKCISFLTML